MKGLNHRRRKSGSCLSIRPDILPVSGIRLLTFGSNKDNILKKYIDIGKILLEKIRNSKDATKKIPVLKYLPFIAKSQIFTITCLSIFLFLNFNFLAFLRQSLTEWVRCKRTFSYLRHLVWTYPYFSLTLFRKPYMSQFCYRFTGYLNYVISSRRLSTCIIT